MTRERRRLLAAVLTAAVVVVAFFGVLPRVADVGAAWRLLGSLPFGWAVVVAALTLVNLATYPWLSMASLPGLRFRPALVVTQASTAVANTVPAGGGVGIGVTYAMYGGYGFGNTAVALSITTTGVANVAVKLAMPFAAALVLAVSGDAPGWAWTAARIGLVLLVVTIVASWVAVRRGVGAVVRPVARLVARVRHRDRSAADAAASAWVEALRVAASDIMRPRGPAILALAVVSHLALYALFAACLAAVDAGIGLALSFAVFAVVRLGLAVPVTPGGVGVAEAGYAAALAGAGAAAEPAVAAVLLFRALSYLLPIPVGLVCWLLRRRGTMAPRPGALRPS